MRVPPEVREFYRQLGLRHGRKAALASAAALTPAERRAKARTAGLASAAAGRRRRAAAQKKKKPAA